MKKFFALVLALVMALSLTTMAWGAAQIHEVATPEALLALFDGDTTNTEVADGDTVKLTADVALPETGGLLKIDGQKVTLDLNGKTLSRVNTGSTANTVVYLKTGELTIKDSATGGKVAAGDGQMALQVYGGTTMLESGSLVSTNLRTLVVRNATAEFVMNGGAISCATDAAVFVRADAKFTMNAGTVSGGTYGIATNNTEPNPTISVLGGSVTGTNDAGIFLSTGTLTVSGGSVSGATGIYVKTGTVTISGDAVVSGTGADVDYQYNGGGMYSTGDALVIDNCGYSGGAPVVSVTGGTFTSANADAVASYVGNGETAVVDEFISGGSFSVLPNESYLAAGYSFAGDSVVSSKTVTSAVEGLYAKATSQGATAAPATVKSFAAVDNKVDETTGAYVADGNIAYFMITGDAAKYVKVATVAEADMVVYTDAACKNVYMYLDAVNPVYFADGAVEVNFGTACGQYNIKDADYNKEATYYTTAAVKGALYVADKTSAMQLMVNGKLVAVSGPVAIDKVAHKAIITTDKKGAVESIKCAACGCVAAKAGNFASLPTDAVVVMQEGNAYWYWTAAVSGGTVVESAETFDAGIAMYVGMSVMAAAGSVVVFKKRED